MGAEVHLRIECELRCDADFPFSFQRGRSPHIPSLGDADVSETDVTSCTACVKILFNLPLVAASQRRECSSSATRGGVTVCKEMDSQPAQITSCEPIRCPSISNKLHSRTEYFAWKPPRARLEGGHAVQFAVD